ncbi:protein-export chaperone SecB [Rivihabitans pingtungensis]|uniref:protein-export chaperone SecB n=1 Tax=Rivihabitans pingtungensis TaxID=1054498 RepID=UPI000D76AB25|nr:protein-export chaperone SecB [Rivihabitans pingtungensis]
MQITLLKTYAEEFSLSPFTEEDINEDEVDFTIFTAIQEGETDKFLIGFDLLIRVQRNNQFCTRYLAEFKSSEKITPELLDTNSFFHVNAPAIAYPFMRAFIATVLLNAGYEPPMLPAVNFQELYNIKRSSN